jgi:hypothetical protein
MTDNLGLITRVEQSLPFDEPFPNITLKADWDVTHEIVETLKAMTITPSFEHIKGHQDDHTAYDDLSLEAQLNVDADEEAGRYQQTFPAHRPNIPRLPHNLAQLRIKDQTISSKLKESIREAYTVPPYMEYLQARNKWDTECLATIDWKAYTQAVRRFGHRRIQITKLCNDLLPTACRVNRYDSLTTKDCIHCGQLEDRDHLLRCSFPPRVKWRTKLLSDLRHTHSSTECNPYLIDILLDGIHSWIIDTPMIMARYPRRYHRLITEQTTIGWRHVFNGRLTTQWRIRQDRYLRMGKITTRYNTGANWALRTLTTIWKAFFVLWKERNEAIHGHDLSTQNQARHRRLRAKMELLHSQRDQVLAIDADAFIGETPAALDTFLSVSTATHIQNWLHVWRPVIVSSMTKAKDLSIRGVRTMTEYFVSDAPPDQRPRHPNSRSHRTTRPRHRTSHSVLPPQPFNARSLRSFF